MGLSRKGKGGGHGGGGGGHDGSGGLRWLLTYADMITLLLALFVYLFSISEVSTSKMQSFSTSFASYFGIGTLPTSMAVPSGGDSVLPLPGMRRPSDQPAESRKQSRVRSLAPMLRREQYRQLQNEVSQILPGLVQSGQLTFLETREGLVLRLRDSALFGLGSAGMSPEAMETLNILSDMLREISNPVRVEGHTDSLPLRGGNYKSNWELSGARAAAVVEYFMQQGIAPERLSISGYGEYRPLEPNLPGTGNPRNRRVEILILNSARPIGYAEGLAPLEALQADPGTIDAPPADGAAAPVEQSPTPDFHSPAPEGALLEIDPPDEAVVEPAD
jgi:chemotaxis protein MotB